MEGGNKEISLVRQCDLLELPRSSYSYRSSGEGDYNLQFMRLLDEAYTSMPFYGVRRLTAWLRWQGLEHGQIRGGLSS